MIKAMVTSTSAPSVLRTDFYELTSAYGLWREGKHEEYAVEDYTYRIPPFGGEYAIFAGLRDLVDFVAKFRYTGEHIARVKQWLRAEPGFFDWLARLDYSGVQIYAMREGTLSFPRVPMIRVEGPAAPVQMLETHLLERCNYPSNEITNAARYRVAAGDDKILLEFGLRRAHDGMRASHYAILGGFDGTSNVEAAEILGETPRGTMMHAFVEMFSGLDEIQHPYLKTAGGTEEHFVERVLAYRKQFGFEHTNDGELAAFASYAMSHPNGFVGLVDTYSTLLSGVPNFACVASALADFGYTPAGIRIDSGDLVYLSREARRIFKELDASLGTPVLARSKIFVSNDVNEKNLWSFRAQPNEIDGYGIGTHLVTCEGSPAFGGVYKLVMHRDRKKIKLSDTIEKTIIPGRKDIYRLIGADGKIILYLMVEAGSSAPRAGEPILARHPFIEGKRVNVIPTRVEPLLELVWDGHPVVDLPGPAAIKQRVRDEITLLREDHLRPTNPTPVKVSVSEGLYHEMHELLMKEAPVATLR